MVLLVESKDLDRIRPNPYINPPPPPYSYPQSPTGYQHSPRGGRSTFVSPPPFTATTSFSNPSSSSRISSLPQHIILQIVGLTCPSSSHIRADYHTQSLFWLSRSLRLVSRAFYVASMHVLRSSYLPLYVIQTKYPYTTDPFPAAEPGMGAVGWEAGNGGTILLTTQRETAVLDLFLAVKVSEDLKADETELHLDLDLFKDVFELMQPKARTEDLVRYYGVRAGLITLNPSTMQSTPPSSGYSTPSHSLFNIPIPFSLISVNYSPRKVSLMVNRKTVVPDMRREKDESLESVAKRLVKELARVLGYEVRAR